MHTPEERAALNRERSLAYYRKKAADPKYKEVIRVRSREFTQRHPWLFSYREMLKRCKRDGTPCDIDTKWARSRWTGKCEITGLPFTKNPAGWGRGPWPFSPSIDRVDPTQGYVNGNCIFVMFGLNALKSIGTYSDAFLIARAFVKAVESTGIPPEFGVQTLVARALHGA